MTFGCGLSAGRSCRRTWCRIDRVATRHPHALRNGFRGTPDERRCRKVGERTHDAQAILVAVCGEGRAVTDFERQAGWRDRYEIEKPREALDDVAECRGLITRRFQP